MCVRKHHGGHGRRTEAAQHPCDGVHPEHLRIVIYCSQVVFLIEVRDLHTHTNAIFTHTLKHCLAQPRSLRLVLSALTWKPLGCSSWSET